MEFAKGDREVDVILEYTGGRKLILKCVMKDASGTEYA